MFSARSCSPPVIKIFVPVSLKLPFVTGHSARLDHAEISARVRFGETHSAGPSSRIHLRQVALLELLAAVLAKGQCRARGKDGEERKGRISCKAHLFD